MFSILLVCAITFSFNVLSFVCCLVFPLVVFGDNCYSDTFVVGANPRFVLGMSIFCSIGCLFEVVGVLDARDFEIQYDHVTMVYRTGGY